jgi:two-component system sensor histidine kinase CpxA
MRSIRTKILAWSFATLALSLAAFWAISHAVEPRGPSGRDPFWSLIRFLEDDACRAYEEGGPAELARHLGRLDARLPGEHHLTDTRGIDLVSGVDRSAFVGRGRIPREPPRLPDGRVVLVGHPRGGRYHFVTIIEPWFGPPETLPYYAVVALLIAGSAAVLAAHLGSPLRALQRVVERFGRGDLAARSGPTSARRDEIGALARSFDEMAGRIETLLGAERRLLQDVSHELRSPLARLGFAVELARTGSDREAALARVRKEVDRMTALVGGLLELTRLEGDPGAGEAAPVALGGLLAEIVAACEVEAAARGGRLELHAGSDPVLDGDRELLHRAVENVVRNAIRHAPEGTPVEIAMTAAPEAATIVVRDHGPGVPEALADDIFRPFVRVEADRSRSSGGVGLGLAIARRAVHVHGGTIAARNAEPGLAVTITLPLRRQVSPTHEEVGAKPAPA